MSAKRNLKQALSSIDAAKSSLESADRKSDEIITALSDLDDAEVCVMKAIRELPDD